MAALDIAMAEQRYLGGLDRLRALVDTWTGAERPAARAALGIADDACAAAESPGRWSIRSSCCNRSSSAHDREHDDRRRRARPAVVTALDGLIAAYRRHDPSATGTVTELSAAIRRWLGSQTFDDRDDSRRRPHPRRAIGAVCRSG